MSELEVEIREPGKEARRLPLRPGFGIGRHPDNAGAVEDPKVSGFHARVEARGEGLAIVDLGSSNGTHVLEGPSLAAGESHPIAAGLRFMTGYTEWEVFERVRAPRPEATRMMAPLGEALAPAATESHDAPAELPPIPDDPPRPRERPLDVRSKGIVRAPNSDLAPIADPDSVSEEFPTVEFESGIGQAPQPSAPKKPGKKAPPPAPEPPAEPEDLSESKTVGFPRIVFEDDDRPAGPGPDPDEETILSPPDRRGGAGSPPPASPPRRARFSDADTVKTPLPLDLAKAVPQDDEATVIARPTSAPGSPARADESLGFMRARLVIAGDGNRSVEPITAREFTIGRRQPAGPQEANCAIDSMAVSSRHAAILFDQGRFFLEDRGSRNGTRVGQKKLDAMAQREIHADDPLAFGIVDALFLVDRDHQLRELPRGPYRDALDQLVKRKLLDRERADQLWQRCAIDGEHPAEALLMAGTITVRQWCEALDAGGSAGGLAGGPRRLLVWLLVAVTVLLLGAIAFILMKDR